VAGYYDPLVTLIDHSVTESFVRPEHRAMMLVDEDPESLLDKMKVYSPPDVHKWIDLEES
jgi:predicted Rossmann-fold nucleotide-binding protein